MPVSDLSAIVITGGSLEVYRKQSTVSAVVLGIRDRRFSAGKGSAEAVARQRRCPNCTTETSTTSLPDVEGNRLFVTAEENSKVLIFDLKTNKLIHTIDDVKAPHSLLYRADLKKLFVVDSDLGEVKIYETDSYKPAGSIKVREGADASGYDPSSKLFYVVNGGKDAKLPNAYISVIDVDVRQD